MLNVRVTQFCQGQKHGWAQGPGQIWEQSKHLVPRKTHMREQPGQRDRGAAHFPHCFFGRIHRGLCGWGGEGGLHDNIFVLQLKGSERRFAAPAWEMGCSLCCIIHKHIAAISWAAHGRAGMREGCGRDAGTGGCQGCGHGWRQWWEQGCGHWMQPGLPNLCPLSPRLSLSLHGLTLQVTLHPAWWHPAFFDIFQPQIAAWLSNSCY